MRLLVDNEREVHPYLENLKSIAKGIHKTLGSKSEVIIHDLSIPESSIIFIAGELTDRDLGAPVTDLVLRTVRTQDNPEDILNYRTKYKDGRIFKSSTMFVKDKEKVIGCLCTNYDITDLLLTQNIINEICLTVEEKNDDSSQQENFASNINEVLDEIIEEAKSQVDKPVPFMNKDDKLKVIKVLDKRGVFMIKGAVESIADDLGVSRYTIYNYLKEIDRN